MYQQDGLQDYVYMTLYVIVTITAILSSLYLLRKRPDQTKGAKSPLPLRRWAAAFLIAAAMSHIWWPVIGNVVLSDDIFMRNALNIGLDTITLVPLMMATLLRMLQDRKRPIWPAFVAVVPAAALCFGMGVVGRNADYEWLLSDYILFVAVGFVVYMTFAVQKYSKWLRDNYADLENKEVWQSMLLMLAILLMFVCYKSNYGGFLSEYIVQINTIILIGFLVWRVETLPILNTEPETTESIDDYYARTLENHKNSNEDNEMDDNNKSTDNERVDNLAHIGLLLTTRCEIPKLYLQYDMSLNRLCISIGTNRTYLSTYFHQQGITYNTYINRLRIEHFMRLYREPSTTMPLTIQEMAQQSGFLSYRTFASAFKKITGMTASEWMEKEEQRR
jgi:AraC-like DNA-binding protein